MATDIETTTNPAAANRKPRVFTVDNPLVIQVRRVGSDWTIQPAPGQIPAMQARLADHDGPAHPGNLVRDRILNEWSTNRNAQQNQPDFFDHDHPPIIIHEGEFVRFECVPPKAFVISCEKNTKLDGVQDTPDNPFGWTAPRPVTAGGSITAAVLLPAVDSNGEPTEPGPKDQGFYKFHAIVDPGGDNIEVDPDGYCDR